MRGSRSAVVLAAAGVGFALAACSSSKPTGPSAAKLAAAVDSVYKVDSAAGNSARLQIESLILISLDEGFTPTTVSVATDGSNLSMNLIGLVAYDTLGGVAADSDIITVGWTSDYQTYLLTAIEVSAGPDRIPAHRIRLSSQQMGTIRALTAGGRVTARGSTTDGAELVVGTADVIADTTSLIASEGAGTGSCKYQHIVFANIFGVDASTVRCNPITVTQTFALHFPATVGIDATLEHMTMTPSQTAHGARVLVSP
jgi:hypothetical protein